MIILWFLFIYIISFSCLCPLGNLKQRGCVELHHRKTIAWAKFNKHRTVLTNKHVSLKLRLKFLIAVVTQALAKLESHALLGPLIIGYACIGTWYGCNGTWYDHEVR